MSRALAAAAVSTILIMGGARRRISGDLDREHMQNAKFGQ